MSPPAVVTSKSIPAKSVPVPVKAKKGPIPVRMMIAAAGAGAGAAPFDMELSTAKPVIDKDRIRKTITDKYKEVEKLQNIYEMLRITIRDFPTLSETEKLDNLKLLKKYLRRDVLVPVEVLVKKVTKYETIRELEFEFKKLKSANRKPRKLSSFFVFKSIVWNQLQTQPDMNHAKAKVIIRERWNALSPDEKAAYTADSPEYEAAKSATASKNAEKAAEKDAEKAEKKAAKAEKKAAKEAEKVQKKAEKEAAREANLPAAKRVKLALQEALQEVDTDVDSDEEMPPAAAPARAPAPADEEDSDSDSDADDSDKDEDEDKDSDDDDEDL